MALAMVLLTTTPAAAERLLTPVAATSAPGAAAAALPGVAHVQALALGRRALADLRAQAHAVVADFPLGADRTATVTLTRFDPFTPGVRVEVMEAGGPRRIALPDNAYFAGDVAGEAGSRIVLIAAADAVHGFVEAGGEIYVFGPDGAGGHQSYALRDVDPDVHPAPTSFCENDLHPELAELPGTPPPAALLPPPVAGAPALKEADLAIETDQELRAKFATDAAALDYLARLLAATTAIYERDVAVRLRFSYIRLWDTADPWTATSTTGSLDEVRAYWLDASHDMNAIAGPHDLVHFVSGKPVQGGVAYVNVLCNQSFGFAASQVNGSFNATQPSTMWDVMVFGHETGHMFGSPHTHCYSPPIDKCYNAEPGCYSGPVVVSRGTVMSYCHLLGGIQNIDLEFGSVVSARIATSVANATCLASIGTSVCGNAIVDAGEQCDDGNTAAGDCCSPTCQREAPGASCASDNDPCTTDQCSAAGICTHTAIPACGVTTSTTTSTTRTTTTSATSTTRDRRTTTTTSTTSTTTLPDGDGDGVPDGADDCPGTPPGDLVNDRGCSVCPCDARADGTPWESHRAYVRCVHDEVQRRQQLGLLSPAEARAVMRAQRSTTCGRPSLTRCCVFRPGRARGACRLVTPTRCAAAGARAGLSRDMGDGACFPNPCRR